MGIQNLKETTFGSQLKKHCRKWLAIVKESLNHKIYSFLIIRKKFTRKNFPSSL